MITINQYNPIMISFELISGEQRPAQHDGQCDILQTSYKREPSQIILNINI